MGVAQSRDERHYVIRRFTTRVEYFRLPIGWLGKSANVTNPSLLWTSDGDKAVRLRNRNEAHSVAREWGLDGEKYNVEVD